MGEKKNKYWLREKRWFIILPPSQGSSSQGLLTAYYMGPLDHPYFLLYLLILPDISYFFWFSVDLPCPLLYSILLPFLLCIHISSLLFSSGMDSFSTISNFPPFAFNILYHISRFPNCIGVLPYIFLVTLY